MLHGVRHFRLQSWFGVHSSVFTICRLRVNSLELRCAHIPTSHGKRRSRAYSREVQGSERLSVMVRGARKEGFERKYLHPPKPALEQVMLLKTGFQKESLAFTRQEESRFAQRLFADFERFLRVSFGFIAGFGRAANWKPGFGSRSHLLSNTCSKTRFLQNYLVLRKSQIYAWVQTARVQRTLRVKAPSAWFI